MAAHISKLWLRSSRYTSSQTFDDCWSMDCRQVFWGSWSLKHQGGYKSWLSNFLTQGSKRLPQPILLVNNPWLLQGNHAKSLPPTSRISRWNTTSSSKKNVVHIIDIMLPKLQKIDSNMIYVWYIYLLIYKKISTIH